MDTNFQNKWFMTVREKQTTIIAGIDPQGELEKKEDKELIDWCIKYIDELKDHVAGFKLNPTFFEGRGKVLDEVSQYLIDTCRENGLVSIYDRKLPEIGNTNESGMRSIKKIGYDAVTIAPMAGNGESAIKYGRSINLGIINMGLMSNPEFIREASDFIHKISGKTLMQVRIEESMEAGVDGLVYGGTFYQNDESLKEGNRLLAWTRNQKAVIFLVPGLGAQGGKIEEFLDRVTQDGVGIHPKRFMLSLSRELLFAENRVELAKEYNRLIKGYISPVDQELIRQERGLWK